MIHQVNVEPSDGLWSNARFQPELFHPLAENINSDE
jgi:hypothetical protein